MIDILKNFFTVFTVTFGALSGGSVAAYTIWYLVIHTYEVLNKHGLVWLSIIILIVSLIVSVKDSLDYIKEIKETK